VRKATGYLTQLGPMFGQGDQELARQDDRQMPPGHNQVITFRNTNVLWTASAIKKYRFALYREKRAR
jgi:hypothetical protein